MHTSICFYCIFYVLLFCFSFQDFRFVDLIVIDGVEELSTFAFETLNRNINHAKGLGADSDAIFGNVQLLMLSGLMEPNRRKCHERFVGSFLHSLTTRCDFAVLPDKVTRTADHAPRGQSPSPERGGHFRCAPPARKVGPAGRGQPRGGRGLRSSPPPRVTSPSPTRSDGRGAAPSRQLRPRRGPDLTAILLERLHDLDLPESDDEDPPADNDPDFTPHPNSHINRGRGRKKVRVPDYIKSKWVREKYLKAVNLGTLRAAKGKLDPLTSVKARYKSFGFLGTERCTECKALFFKGEGIRSKTKPGFLQCCQHGKVHFDPPTMPEWYRELVDKDSPMRKEFLKYIRNMNNYFALATFQGKFACLTPNFPHVVKLHGQIQVLLHQGEPKNYVPRSEQAQRIMHSQMFFVDPADAQKNRDAFEPNRRLNADLVLKIHDMMKECNALYRSFERMATLVKKAKREWKEKNPGEMPPDIKLVFKRRAGDSSKITFRPTGGATFDTLRHEEPTALEGGNTEIAAVFNSNERPVNVPLWVCQQGRPVKMGPRNPLREPLLYPLMYPDGLPTWYTDTPHRRNQTGVQNRVTIRQYYSFLLHLRKKKYLQRMLGALTQQWIVEGWVRVEDSDLDYIKNLDYLRVSTRPQLTKFLSNLAEREGMDLGKEIKLPSSFSHSPAQMQRYYMNSIQMVRVSTPFF